MAANVLQWQLMFCNGNQYFAMATNVLLMAANVLQWQRIAMSANVLQWQLTFCKQPMFCNCNQCFTAAIILTMAANVL